jgi:hypothetical protein
VPVKTASIAMESEDLRISAGQIVVRYVFRNDSGRDIDTLVAFPLRELDGDDIRTRPFLLPSEDPVNFVDFQAMVGGKPVATSVEARAFLGGRDVTARIHSLGLPVSVVDSAMQSAIRRLPAAKRGQLEKDNLLLADPHVSQASGWDPLWSTRVNFYWTQRFPAKAAIAVEHSYRPVAGGRTIYGWGDGSTEAKENCGTAEDLDQIRREKELHPPKNEEDVVWHEKRIRFVLKTARNWNGPIRHFRLAVAAARPNDILMTCIPGLKRVSPPRYELTLSDFRPDADLDLLFLEADK